MLLYKINKIHFQYILYKYNNLGTLADNHKSLKTLVTNSNLRAYGIDKPFTNRKKTLLSNETRKFERKAKPTLQAN
jgi:hypothetical protein